MKIVINENGLIEDRPLREVERLINLGKGHLPVEVKTKHLQTPHEYNMSISEPEPIETLSEITYADLDEINIFREPSTEIDLIEPIPIDHYVNFEEPINKPKKAKKK